MGRWNTLLSQDLHRRRCHAVGMRGHLGLLRPVNCLIAALGVGIGAAVAVGLRGLEQIGFRVGMAALAGFSFTGAGNALNDYFDRGVDTINHPSRPIPSGSVTPPAALRLAAILFAVSLLFGVLAGWLAFIIVAVNLLFMVSYELRFKRQGWGGNLVIGWLVASLFLFGGVAAYSDSTVPLQRVAWLGLLAFLATLGREVAKDIEDLAGDVDRRTLPMVLGVNGAGFVAATSFILAVILSPLPYTTGVLGGPYLGIVLLADAIFIYCAWFSAENPGMVSNVSKYGMVVALIAFLAGGAL